MVSAATEPAVPALIITEIKLTNQNTNEFVSLYNFSNAPVDLEATGLYLEYAKSAFASDSCMLADWPTGSSTSEVKLVGVLEPGAVKSVSISLTDRVGGSLRLVSRNSSTAIYDAVHWGDTDSPAPCSSDKASIPYNGDSLQRYKDCATGSPVATGSSSNDFAITSTPSPGAYAGVMTDTCQVPEPNDPDEEAPPVLKLGCEGVVISEVLPNPSGSDTGHEFIELYNPSDEVITLDGCALQVAGSSKQHVFYDSVIESQSYLSFSDTITGLTLPNTAGATVWLLSTEQVEISVAAYPGGLADGVAWGNINGTWQITYAPTPQGINQAMPYPPCSAGQERNPETNRCVSIAVASANVVACKEGQERNLETNRCRAIVVATALTTCKLGQERNPETNRCRSAIGATSTLKSCEAGQERNPETNRCRKVASAAIQAACKAGQERSKETNRCRKITMKGSLIASVKDVQTGAAASKTSWYITGIVVLAALAYAIYEWRQDILLRLRRLKK